MELTYYRCNDCGYQWTSDDYINERNQKETERKHGECCPKCDRRNNIIKYN